MKVKGYQMTEKGNVGSATVFMGCECGICQHRLESECIRSECKCCFNFHIRSGVKH